ncbi:MAG: DUF835 domain-containing protein, partial [Thermoplasmata archaeon]
QKNLLVGAILLLLAAVVSNLVINFVLRPGSAESVIVLSKRVQATFDLLFALAIGAFLVVMTRPQINTFRDFQGYMVNEFPNAYLIYAFIQVLGIFSVLTTSATVEFTGMTTYIISFPPWFLLMMLVAAASFLIYVPYNLLGYLRTTNPARRVKRNTYLILVALQGYSVTEVLTEVVLPNMGIDIRLLGFLINVALLSLVAFAVRERGFVQEFLVPVPEAHLETAPSFDMERGFAYLIPEDTAAHSLEIFTDMVTHGVRGLCVTRQHPDRVAQAYGLEKTPILWLSRVVSDKNCVRPTPPENVAMAIDHFLEMSEGSVVLLDGVEYLVSHNDFASILTLLHDLNERVSLTNAVLLLPVDPQAIETREFNLLKRDLRVIYPGTSAAPRASDEAPPEPYVGR